MALSSVSASKAKSFLRRYSHRIMRSMKLQRYRILAALLLVVILWPRSNASLGSSKGSSREIPGGESIKVAIFPISQPSANKSDKHNPKVVPLVSDSSGGEIAAGENCSAVPLSGTCQGKNLTACVHQYGAGNGTNETFLLIWNCEETPLKVKVRFLPANITTDEIQVAKPKKVNITAYIGGNSSIVLDGREGDCVMDMVFPSPSPPLITSGSDKGGSQVSLTPECLVPSKSCRAKNLTACLHYDRNTTKGALLLVQNGGEIPLTVNITLSPANTTLGNNVELLYQQWQTVNVTDQVVANSSIHLSTGDWVCVVDMVSESNSPRKSSAYVWVLLFVSGIPAAALAYWKLRAAARRADKIPYEQLEMGMANTNSIRGRTSETAGEDWNQSWGDGDWEGVEAVKSPSGVQKGNLLIVGIKDD